jgi:hypothetical protein
MSRMIQIDVPTADPLPKPRKALPLLFPQHAFSGSPRGSSFYSRLLRCAREHALGKKLRPILDDEALTVGSLFHLVLEVYYSALMQLKYPYTSEQKFAAEREAAQVLSLISMEPGYEETFATVSRLARAYFDEYRETDQWEIIAPEMTVGVTAPFTFTARLDLVVRDHGKPGKPLAVVEHKTARAITPDLVSGYQLSLQILGQAYLWQNVIKPKYPGERFEGIIVNIITKHVTPRFLRVPAFPSQDHLEEFAKAISAYDALEVAYAVLGHPPDFTKCSGAARGYKQCSFYDICWSHPKLDVEMPPPGFVLGDAPEDVP